MKNFKLICLFCASFFLFSCDINLKVNIREKVSKTFINCDYSDLNPVCSLNKNILEQLSLETRETIEKSIADLELINSVKKFNLDWEFDNLDDYIVFLEEKLTEVNKIKINLIDNKEAYKVINKNYSKYRHYKREIIKELTNQLNLTSQGIREKIDYSKDLKRKYNLAFNDHLNKIANFFSNEKFLKNIKNDSDLTQSFNNDYYEVLLSNSLSDFYFNWDKIESRKLIVKELWEKYFYSLEEWLYESIYNFLKDDLILNKKFVFETDFWTVSINNAFEKLKEVIYTSAKYEIELYRKNKNSIFKNKNAYELLIKNKFKKTLNKVLWEPYKVVNGIKIQESNFEVYGLSDIVISFYLWESDVNNITSLTLFNAGNAKKIKITNNELGISKIYWDDNLKIQDFKISLDNLDLENGLNIFKISSINGKNLSKNLIINIHKSDVENFYKTSINNEKYYWWKVWRWIWNTVWKNFEWELSGELWLDLWYKNKIYWDITNWISGYNLNFSLDDIIPLELSAKWKWELNYKWLSILWWEIFWGIFWNLRKTSELDFTTKDNIIQKKGQQINDLLLLDTLNNVLSFDYLNSTQTRQIERIKEGLWKEKIFTSLLNSTIDYKVLSDLFFNQNLDIHKLAWEWLNYEYVKYAWFWWWYWWNGKVSWNAATSLINWSSDIKKETNYHITKDDKNNYVFKFIVDKSSNLQFSYSPEGSIKKLSTNLIDNSKLDTYDKLIAHWVQGWLISTLKQSDKYSNLKSNYLNKSIHNNKNSNLIREISLYAKKDWRFYKKIKIVDKFIDKTYYNSFSIDPSEWNSDLWFEYIVELDDFKWWLVIWKDEVWQTISNYINNEWEYFLNIYNQNIIWKLNNLKDLYAYLKIKVPQNLSYNFDFSLIWWKNNFDSEYNFSLMDYLWDELFKKAEKEYSTMLNAKLKIEKHIKEVNEKLKKRGSKSLLNVEDYLTWNKKVKITKRDKNNSKELKKLVDIFNKNKKSIKKVLKLAKFWDIKTSKSKTYYWNLDIFKVKNEDGILKTYLYNNKIDENSYYTLVNNNIFWINNEILTLYEKLTQN